MTQGYNHERGAFVQAYGSSALDASNLLMPLVKLRRPDRPAHALDPRRRRSASSCPTRSSTATTPSAPRPTGWRAARGRSRCARSGTSSASRGRDALDEARLTFEKMLTYANHLGLYAEQIGPSGEALGNFPQAFTHLALISAAFTLNRTLESPPPH